MRTGPLDLDEAEAEAEAEALFYDWHNDRRLRAQRDDVGYWLNATRRAVRPLVLGAGTGRIAVPLARTPGMVNIRTTTAVDLSGARLRRIPNTPGLVPVRADIRLLPLLPGFDAVIIPYSTLQLLRTTDDRDRALAEAARVLAPGSLLHIDVSASFDSRTAADWHVALRAPCEALGTMIVEWERRTPYSDHIVIEKSFRKDNGETLIDVHEHWVFLRELGLEIALDRAGLDLVGIDHGYGHESTAHRQIHSARRRLTI